jgi:hypothetical protein
MPFILSRITFSRARLTKLMCCISLVFFVWKDAYAAKSPHETQVQLSLIAQHHTSDKTWLDGGLGRFDLSSNQVLAELQMLYRYKFTRSLSFITHLQAQHASESLSSNHLGLIDFKLHYSKDLDWHQNLSFSLGQFFLPTSMENAQSFWESPYSIHFSALNSWIGEEFRPIGLDAQYQYISDNNSQLSVAATLFGGNDSMGALLAYRGWSIGRHRSTLGDVLSLPNLDTLNDGGAFSDQRDDGTRPFGKDLDNRLGYALRTQYIQDDLQFSLSWIDNRGDRKLHQGEYAWDTRFGIIGLAWLATESLEVLAEATQGESTMGDGPGVDISFYAAYVMASYLHNDYRYSMRLEQFGADDRDAVDQENNDLGRSLTLAIMFQPDQQPLEIGLEAIYLNTERQRSVLNKIEKDSDSISISGMLRYSF